MTDPRALETHYKNLSNRELLKFRAEGGFTTEAELLLNKELVRRNLTLEEAKRTFAPEWLEEASTGAVGVLVLANGEHVTAEVAKLDLEEELLSVKVISPDIPKIPGGRRKHRTIPLDQITSFTPEPNLMEEWPYSDPCRDLSISHPRSDLLTVIFLCMTIGSVPLFLLLVDKPFGLQGASIITYTLFEVFFTFAHHGTRSGPDVPPFKFTCPAVEPQIPRLLWRHLGFLIALVVLQTAMMATRPHLPNWWFIKDRKGMPPFDGAVLLLCIALAYTQVFTNRALLKRAHREFSPQEGG